MLFNADPSKPDQEVLFSRKKKVQILPTINLNNFQVERASHHKRPGILLDEKLNFKEHINIAILKSLMTIYNAFLRPLIDYGNIIYDQPQNESFCEKQKSVQYKAALAITGAIQSTSRDKIFQELGLESLKSRRWYKHLRCMFKIMKEEAPNYLINLFLKCETNTRTRNNSIPTFNRRTDCFKYSFFSSTLNDFFNLDPNIRNSESI